MLGIVLGCGLIFYVKSFRADAEKRILAAALVIAAVIYIGFALIWGDAKWVFVESAGAVVYGIFAWASIRHSAYWLAFGWLLHPIWDAALHIFGTDSPVAPEWYTYGCISFDWLVAGYIFFRIGKSKFS